VCAKEKEVKAIGQRIAETEEPKGGLKVWGGMGEGGGKTRSRRKSRRWVVKRVCLGRLARRGQRRTEREREERERLRETENVGRAKTCWN
jgi:hypothetical protein